MNIALLAHDSKKELMIQFCAAYNGVLSQHELCAPTTTGKLIRHATEMPVELLLPCSRGGSQQIGQRVACGEIDMVVFFCDASGRESTQDADHIARLCDRHTVPFASNIATAEALILGLIHGDMDWRKPAPTRRAAASWAWIAQ